MLWTIVMILLILWLVGWLALPSIGALVHILLVVAIIMAIVSLVRGRAVV